MEAQPTRRLRSVDMDFITDAIDSELIPQIYVLADGASSWVPLIEDVFDCDDAYVCGDDADPWDIL